MPFKQYDIQHFALVEITHHLGSPEGANLTGRYTLNGVEQPPVRAFVRKGAEKDIFDAVDFLMQTLVRNREPKDVYDAFAIVSITATHYRVDLQSGYNKMRDSLRVALGSHYYFDWCPLMSTIVYRHNTGKVIEEFDIGELSNIDDVVKIALWTSKIRERVGNV